MASLASAVDHIYNILIILVCCTFKTSKNSYCIQIYD